MELLVHFTKGDSENSQSCLTSLKSALWQIADWLPPAVVCVIVIWLRLETQTYTRSCLVPVMSLALITYLHPISSPCLSFFNPWPSPCYHCYWWFTTDPWVFPNFCLCSCSKFSCLAPGFCLQGQRCRDIRLLWAVPSIPYTLLSYSLFLSVAPSFLICLPQNFEQLQLRGVFSGLLQGKGFKVQTSAMKECQSILSACFVRYWKQKLKACCDVHGRQTSGRHWLQRFLSSISTVMLVCPKYLWAPENGGTL